MRIWNGTLHFTERSQLATNVQNWGWYRVDEAWFDFLWRFKTTCPHFQVLKYHNIGIFPLSTLTMGCFDSNTTFRYTLWYGMARHSFPKIHNFLHLSKASASNTQDVKPCFYMISWHVEEWSTGVWGKWFTWHGVIQRFNLSCISLTCFVSLFTLSFPEADAAHRWQWKGLPSHSSNSFFSASLQPDINDSSGSAKPL